jgi:hypothetical protein
MVRETIRWLEIINVIHFYSALSLFVEIIDYIESLLPIGVGAMQDDFS